jgi:hypothetical protein
LPYYAKFLVDTEYELKNIAAANLRIIVKYLESDDIINKITPIIKSIVSDEHAYVRGIFRPIKYSSFLGELSSISGAGPGQKKHK